jgi:signal transduction histidine kinase
MKIAIAVCQNFEREVRLALDVAGLADVFQVSFPADCAQPPLSRRALTDLLPGSPGAARIEVLGGACCARLARDPGPFAVHRLRQCFDLVAPPALVDSLLSSGAYLVTPGWLARWRERLARQGIGRPTARALFGEAMPNIVLLDTGVDPSCEQSLRELSEFVGVPARAVAVGIDHLRLQLVQIAAERRLEEERAESLRALAVAHRQSTEYAAAFDLIGRLTDITSERSVVQQVLRACAMLFGARTVAFISVRDGGSVEVASEPEAPVDPGPILARLATAGDRRSLCRDGFTLPVHDGQRLLGVLDVQGTAAPDHLEHDFALAMTIARVASLALGNARRYQELQRAQDALAEANVQLEEADRRKDHFLAVLSHELRNPLAPIRNSLYILGRAEPGSEKAAHAQQVIERQVSHLTRLVNDLLDVTRVARGKIQLKRELFDLAELVRRAVEDHRFSFARSGIELRTAIADEPLRMDGDGVRVAQVIGNLLQNAAKFSTSGGSVAVRAEASADRTQAVVQVADTGIGIAPQMIQRLFEPFMQAETTLDRSKGGLGLGLSLVKGLVEMHGGSVSAASEGLGRGAIFTVRFPLRPPDDRRAAAPRQGRRGRPRRVLLIEGDSEAAEALCKALAFDHHSVELARSGEAGIEKAREHRPEVVLCDLDLPGAGGCAVARSLRAEPALGEPVLVALASCAADDAGRCREAGFDFCLAKPPDLQELESLVRGP